MGRRWAMPGCGSRRVAWSCGTHFALLDVRPLSPFRLPYLHKCKKTGGLASLLYGAPPKSHSPVLDGWVGRGDSQIRAHSPHGNFCWEFLTGQKAPFAFWIWTLGFPAQVSVGHLLCPNRLSQVGTNYVPGPRICKADHA